MTLTITGQSGAITLHKATHNPLDVTATGKISGAGTYGVLGSAGTAWTVSNLGTILALASTNASAVMLDSGGLVTNGAGAKSKALIEGGGFGVFVAGAPGTVINHGTISGAHSDGVYLTEGGVVTNGANGSKGALISGGYDGVLTAMKTAVVTNDATITGGHFGVDVAGGGSVVNAAGASINGGTAGLRLDGGNVTFVNDGVVTGGSTGVEIGFYTPSATVVNAGMINGGAGDAVQFFSGNDIVVIDPGAVFVGNVVASATGTNILELASAASAGTITGIGTSFVNFGSVIEDSGASWLLTGNNTLGSGGLVVSGVVDNTGALIGNVLLTANGTLQNGPAAYLRGSVTGNGGNVNVSNYGTIESATTALLLADGGTVDNHVSGTSTGVIFSDNVGISGTSLPTTIVNDGVIIGLQGGVALTNGGTIINGAHNGAATIAGNGGDGVYIYGNSNVVNYGTIAGTEGVVLNGGAVFSATLTNAGYIEGGFGTAVNLKYGANRLIVDTTGRFAGSVIGNGASTLELAAGSGTGTLAGLGNSVSGFGTIVVDSGAVWSFPSASALNSTVVLNNGIIEGNIDLGTNASMTNGGAVQGIVYGVGAGVSVTNSGVIGNYMTTTFGVALLAGGTLVNNGSVYGRNAAVYASHAPATIVNNAFLYAHYGFGVELLDGGRLTNTSEVSSHLGVYIAAGSATVVNDGYLFNGGAPGVKFGAGTTDATLVNAGVITNVYGNAVEFYGLNNRLIIDPGAVFHGTVTANANGSNTLELASAASAGVIASFGSGSNYSGFNSFVVDAGAKWTLTGHGTIAAGQTLTDSGLLTVKGALSNYGAVNGGGIGVAVNNYGLVKNGSLSDPGATIFGNYQGVLSLGANGVVDNFGKISSFSYGVDLAGGGHLNNETGAASIYGGFIGAFLNGGGYVLNYGNIGGGSHAGVELGGGAANALLRNAGTISGNVLLYGNHDKVVVDPGAVFTGNVIASAGSNDTLEFANNGGTGTINGLGSHYTGFAQITVDSGANWYLSGTNTVGGGQQMTNNGELHGTLTVSLGSMVNNGVLVGQINLAGNGSSLNNSGDIVGSGVVGTGYVTIANSGTISDSLDGVQLQGGGSLVNGAGGTILGGVDGIYLAKGGNVVNLGVIGGSSFYGVQFGYYSNGATLTNAGLISGSTTSVKLMGSNDRLIIDPGAVFNGRVVATGANDTLELASAASTGVINGLGSVYAGFSNIIVDAGATWHMYETALGIGVSVNNSGHLTGGIYLGASDSVVNNFGAVIDGEVVSGLHAGVTVTNNGLIGTNAEAVGVAFGNGGTLTNGSASITTAMIFGDVNGVFANGAPATILNDGTIQGANDYGVELAAGGSVFNGTPSVTSASINGGTVGVLLAGPGTIVNDGTISGGSAGVSFGAGSSAQTLVNAGTIIGASGNAVVFDGTNNRLVIDPGAVFQGNVLANVAGTNVLELASAASVGTISGFGTSFTNFGTVQLDANAKWSLGGADSLATKETVSLGGGGSLSVTGSLDVAGTLLLKGTGTLAVATGGKVEIGTKGGATAGAFTVNANGAVSGTGVLLGSVIDNGKVTANGGKLILAGNVGGAGTAVIDTKSVLSVTGTFASGAIVNFATGGTAENLVLGKPANFGAVLSGFAHTDVIDLVGVTGTSASFANHILTVSGAHGSVASLVFSGSYAANAFTVASDHHGGTNVTLV